MAEQKMHCDQTSVSGFIIMSVSRSSRPIANQGGTSKENKINKDPPPSQQGCTVARALWQADELVSRPCLLPTANVTLSGLSANASSAPSRKSGLKPL